MKSNLLRIAEVSELTGVPEGTIRYWVHTGYGPASAKIGRRRVWREDEVVSWLEAQFSSATAD